MDVKTTTKPRTTRGRTTLTPPPVLDEQTAENKQSEVQVIEPREPSEFESALDVLNNLYPAGTEGLECRIYKKENNNSKVFLKKLDYFPDESFVQETFGPGTYILFCFCFEDGKRKFLKSPQINIGDVNPFQGAAQQQTTKENPAGVNSILEQIKAFKDAGLIQQPVNSSSDNFVAIVNMMNEQNKQNMLLFTKLLELQAKPEKTRDEKLLEVLLTKALDKSDPMKEINTILKVKELLTADVAPAPESGFGDILKIAAPLIQMAANNSAAVPPSNTGPTKVQKIIPGKTAALQQKQALLNLIGPEIKMLMKEAIREYEDEAAAPEPEDENNLLPEDDNKKTEHESSEPGNMELLTNNNSETQNTNDMLKGIAEQIKAAPEENKIATLKCYLEQLPVEDVKNFIMGNNVVEDERDFWEYVKKAGRSELVPPEFQDMENVK